MFETMQSFLAFFFPTLALIVLGILFEEKLIAFENKLFAALFGKRRRSKKAAASKTAAQPVSARPALHRVETEHRTQRKHKNRAA